MDTFERLSLYPRYGEHPRQYDFDLPAIEIWCRERNDNDYGGIMFYMAIQHLRRTVNSEMMTELLCSSTSSCSRFMRR